MRLKSLIRTRQRINATRHSTMQGEIIPDGAASHWKSIYEMYCDFPARRNIRATLEDLATITDAECVAAIHAIDAQTECELIRALYYLPQQRNFNAAMPDINNYGAPEIRQMAQQALTIFKVSTGGRLNTKTLDMEFATWLAIEYQKNTGLKPTTITGGSTAFMLFARDYFSAVGRNGKDITKILRYGVREALGKKKRKYERVSKKQKF